MTSLNTSKTMSRGKALKLIKINLPQLPISGRRFYFSRLLNKKKTLQLLKLIVYLKALIGQGTFATLQRKYRNTNLC